jgi:3-oxoacyl-[acyl-carrier-protein] synthase II
MNSPIVVTGMGIVSPLGCGVGAVWKRLTAGESGIRTLERFGDVDMPVQFAGTVPQHSDDADGLDAGTFLDRKEQRKVDLFTLYAIAAAEEALQQAGWRPETDADQQATATIIATGIGGFPTITAAQHTLSTRGYKRLSPFIVPSFLANLAAGNVSIRFGFKGPLGCPVTACAAGVQAVGDGMRLIRSGEADVALVGGAEACIDPLSIGGFNAMKAMSTRNDSPKQASRPFDKDRDGFVMGEGAGLLVIETLAHAESRGAKPLAILEGYGTSADAHHITSGPPDGAGAAAAMNRALSSAGFRPADIHYINAHGTSTPVGDIVEVAGFRNVFGENLPSIPVSSTKSATGHLLGAAGGIESIFTVQSIRTGVLPPTLNNDNVDPELVGLDFVPNVARKIELQHAMCNGLGFGGVNASLIVGAI